MARQIALLRGINVGGRNKVTMSELRELVRELGFDHVRTHLQSGNVVFTTEETPEHAGRDIQARLAESSGVPAQVITRTRNELARVIARDPLGSVASDPSKYFVVFLSAEPDPASLDGLTPRGSSPTSSIMRAASYTSGVRTGRGRAN